MILGGFAFLVRPLAFDGTANLGKCGRAARLTLRDADKMQPEVRLDRPGPLARCDLVEGVSERGTKRLADRCLAGEIELAREQRGVSELGRVDGQFRSEDIKNRSCALIDLVAMLVGAQQYLLESICGINRELVGIVLQIDLELGVSRRQGRGFGAVQELHLEAQAAANDHVVLVQTEHKRLADENLLLDVVVDQVLELGICRRTLPDRGELRGQPIDPGLRDHYLVRLAHLDAIEDPVGDKDSDSQRQKME